MTKKKNILDSCPWQAILAKLIFEGTARTSPTVQYLKGKQTEEQEKMRQRKGDRGTHTERERETKTETDRKYAGRSSRCR
jgi:hypothetical protein